MTLMTSYFPYSNVNLILKLAFRKYARQCLSCLFGDCAASVATGPQRPWLYGHRTTFYVEITNNLYMQATGLTMKETP